MTEFWVLDARTSLAALSEPVARYCPCSTGYVVEKFACPNNTLFGTIRKAQFFVAECQLCRNFSQGNNRDFERDLAHRISCLCFSNVLSQLIFGRFYIAPPILLGKPRLSLASMVVAGFFLRSSLPCTFPKVFCSNSYLISSPQIVGPSMLPTLNSSGDVLLTEHVSPRFSRLKSGDVVMAVKPNDGKVTVVKRIRGMPGERILVHRRGVSHLQDIIVPDGHVWLEGDNPESSTDSRDYGPVPLALVRGRIIARFWPPSKMCLIESRIIHHLSEAEECNVYRDMASVSLYEKQNEEDCLPTTKSPSSA